jgi:hypothetical protein
MASTNSLAFWETLLLYVIFRTLSASIVTVKFSKIFSIRRAFGVEVIK